MTATVTVTAIAIAIATATAIAVATWPHLCVRPQFRYPKSKEDARDINIPVCQPHT